MQSPQPVQLPETFTSVFGLGSPTAFFPVSTWNRWGSLIAGIVFFFGGALLGLFGLYYAFTQSQQYGPAVFMNNLWPFILFSGISVLIGVFGLWSAFANWGKAVAIFSNGLAYNDYKGLQTWRWEEIDQFFFSITRQYTNGIYTGTTYIYTIKKVDGAKLSFDNKYGKNEIPKLGTMLEQATLPIHYRRAADFYNTGQIVPFGPVSISKEGITINKKTYAWQDVDKVSLNNGMLSVAKKGGGWFSGASVMVSGVPNLTALLSIVDQVTGINTK